MEPDRLRRGSAAAAFSCAAGAIVGTGVGAALGVLSVLAVGVVLLSFGRVTFVHGRLSRALRQRSAATEVAGTRLRVGPVGRSVFVAGLTRPEIYCDDVLLRELDGDELAAVLLHERAHQLARDPLRSAVLSSVAPLATRLERGRAWLQYRAAHREIAADRYAIAHGAQPRAIASALLKVLPAGAAHAAAFAPAVELRLRALLGDPVEPPRTPAWHALVVGALVGVAACLVMLHPMLAPDLLAVCCPA